jgi:hypothetical protein
MVFVISYLLTTIRDITFSRGLSNYPPPICNDVSVNWQNKNNDCDIVIHNYDGFSNTFISS